jgi:hypothetical protein
MQIERYVSRELERLHAERCKRDEAEAARAKATSEILEQLDFLVLQALVATEESSCSGFNPDVGTRSQDQSK